jgi:hypothetical protein
MTLNNPANRQMEQWSGGCSQLNSSAEQIGTAKLKLFEPSRPSAFSGQVIRHTQTDQSKPFDAPSLAVGDVQRHVAWQARILV